MSDQPRKHAVRNVVKAVCAAPWAIHEPTMEAICELLDLRRQGYGFTEQEVQARIGIEPQQTPGMQVVGGVAVIPIHGVMAPRMNLMMQISGGTSTQMVAKNLRAAIDDPGVESIVLDIDSPGGTVSGTQELADLVAEAATKKPVRAVATTMMASAAYWVGSAAEEIIVNPSAQVGSIGAFMVYSDDSRADENAGIKHTVVRSAPNKAVPSGYEALDDKGLANLQETVNDAHRQFVGAVSRNRGVSAEYVETNYGGGKSFFGEKAVALGMADRVGTLDEVVSQLAKTGGAPTRPNTKSGGFKMSAKLREKLIARGLVQPGATDEEVAAAAEKLLDDDKVVSGKKDGHETESVLAETKKIGASATEILATIKIASLPTGFDRMAFAETLLKEKVDLVTAIDRINDEVAKHSQSTGTTDVDRVRVTRDSWDATRAAARDAMLIRANDGRWDEALAARRNEILEERGEHAEISRLGSKPAEGAMRSRKLQSVMGMAEICLKADGIPEQVLDRLTHPQLCNLALGITRLESYGIYAADAPLYNVSGMFSSVMLDVSNNSMRKGYTQERATYDQWMKRGQSLPDFRKKYLTLLGEFADPQAIPENGEFPEITKQDEHESYRVEVWGSRFGISWQMMVNDNIGAFTSVPAKMGRSMRRKQNRLAYQVLKDNPTLQDGGALFNSTAQSSAGGHNNLATGSAVPDDTTLTAMELKMLQMIGPTGSDNSDAQALNIQPRYILTPPALKRKVTKLLESQSDLTAEINAGVVNTWKGELQHIWEAELGASFGGSDTAWYLATDPNNVDTLEFAFLQGLETPAIEPDESFTTLGRIYRMYQAFGVAAIDYRGLQKHAGA